jgi:catechol 2,3-dioxygenase-like lactoylglutathione lyase family enzyme
VSAGPLRIWTLGAKVPDLDAEIAFVRALGGELVLDDRIPFGGSEFRVPLLRLGDKYLHIAEEMVYESELAEPLPHGLCHVVFEVADLAAARDAALAAGATEVTGVARVEAGFGVRDVAFLRSPGGILFELVRVIDAGVPSP